MPHQVLELLVQAYALVEQAAASAHLSHTMDPGEVVAAAKAGLQKDALDAEAPRLYEIPFASETKRMTTLHQNGKGVTAFAKGAPEVILEGCDYVLTENGVTPLDLDEKAQILAQAQDMASEALRVLAVASKPDTTFETAEKGMTFLGLAGMIDPPRPEAKAAIATCEEAGIRPIMITGDHAWFIERYGEPSAHCVMRFLTFDAEYANSILSSVTRARSARLPNRSASTSTRTVRDVRPSRTVCA